MQLSSPAFEHEGMIPSRYTCDGSDVSPPLVITDLPPNAATLALVMDDPDAPLRTWVHWVAYDIPPTEEIPEAVGSLGTPGKNTGGRRGYGGPCPPRGTHRYFFTVYAVDTMLGLRKGATRSKLMEALSGHILDQCTLMGTYQR